MDTLQHCRVKVTLTVSVYLFLLFTSLPCMEADSGKKIKKNKTQPNLFGYLNKENNKQLKTVIKLAVCPRTREVSKFLCFTGECVIVRDCLCAHVRV